MDYFHRATFLTSAAKLSQSPQDEGFEVAFVGRSNAGKSSALNALTSQKRLARTSKTPGRTQLINFFTLDDKRRLVDLPGFGYAKVSETTKKDWSALIDDYLRNRQSLKGIVLLMDIRHPMQPFDEQMIQWASQIAIPLRVLLTKADKLRYGARLNVLHSVTKTLKKQGENISVQLFSALQPIGHEELADILTSWLEIPKS